MGELKTGRIYFGIDLGLKGGIVATQNNKIIHKEVMPLIADTDVDVHRLVELMLEFGPDIHVVFEKFGGFFGFAKKAAVSLARQGGCVETAMVLSKTPHTKIVPQVWQKVMWEGTKLVKKSDGRNDTKKISLLTANRLFPGETFLKSDKCSKPHDGLVDAALLSLFGQRKGL